MNDFMLFEFELLPIEAITPWVTPSGVNYLSWFSLTDGFYRLNVGDQYLLNYTNEITEYFKQQSPILNACPKPTWVGYNVVRLWEDILEMLAFILEPLPDNLSAILEKKDSDIKKWKDNVFSQLKNQYIFWDATDWIEQRYLDNTYLVQGASISLWTTNNEVHIRWDNRDCVIEGIPVWSAHHGIYRMPVETFLKEVHSFHERFMKAMEKRVETIVANNGIHSVDVDLKQLIKEQEERKQWLVEALDNPQFIPNIEAALKILSENNLINNKK